MSQVSYFPTSPTPLIGREHDLESSASLLRRQDVRLVTLTGSPGTGKTRLAIALGKRVAGHFEDGCYWVDLTSATTAGVLQSISEQLGVREGGSRDLADLLADYLLDREVLLILDNFEHVLGASGLLGGLLTTCPRIKVLATSRVPLRLRWEHEYVVAPLPVPDSAGPDTPEELEKVPSVQLFLDRARASAPDFELTAGDGAAIAEVCRQLDGLPLAIELAAARSRLLRPKSLAERLERRLDLLTNGPVDLPDRQRTLRGAIGWSYSLLTSDEQAVLRRLAIFIGGCDLEDAEVICRGAGSLAAREVDAIQALVDANLVQIASSASGRSRLRMLETIREYARECLTASTEFEATRVEHRARYLRLLEEAQKGLSGPRQLEWMQRLEVEHSNILAALESAIASNETRAVRFIVILWRFWWRRGYLTEGRRLISQVLQMPVLAERDELQCSALLPAGLLALWHADYDEAQTLLSESIRIAREIHDQRSLAYGLVFLGRVARDLGEPRAATLLSEGVEIMRTLGDAWGLAVGLHFLGLSLAQSATDLAESCFHESIDIFRNLGAPGDLAMPLRGMGLVKYLQGEMDKARTYFEESAALFRSVNDEWSSSMVMHDLGSVAEAEGAVNEASVFLTESLRSWRKLGNKRGSLICLAGLAKVAFKIDAIGLAVRLFAAVDALATRYGIALEPTDGDSFQARLESARRSLGESDFASAWTEGHRLDFDAAVDAALSVAGTLIGREPRASISLAGDLADPLSPREREVASLLPLGLSNREIAAALTITEGTANLHVKHILGKLGFKSRAQVAAWIVEQTHGPNPTASLP